MPYGARETIWPLRDSFGLLQIVNLRMKIELFADVGEGAGGEGHDWNVVDSTFVVIATVDN